VVTRVAFDIGGTFNDVIVLHDDGRVTSTKTLSLMETVGSDISAYLEGVSVGPVEIFVHATTIGSNAVIEGSTAPTGLLTTRGFRDELEMRGQRRANIYDARWERPPPLVPRERRLEVTERILASGSVETAVDPVEVERLTEGLLEQGVEAIAVSLLNSYVNPENEIAVGEVVARLAPHLALCLSSSVHPEIREYERTSTTVINASLIPLITDYLDRLERQLVRPHDGRLLVMQSNGGVMDAASVRRRPVYVIESGPAAGALAAARLSTELALGDSLAFDMGGTTAKACLVEDGVPTEKSGMEIGGSSTRRALLFGSEGHAVRVPTLDIVEVGTGGGSIAWVDAGGILRVGPTSAGADPGPCCYGGGGTEPTWTDANVVLGFLNDQQIAGGAVQVDRGAARQAMARLGERMGLTAEATARGVIDISNAMTMRALRAVSVERGRDPRNMALVAFGGAGPVHAAALAVGMGMGRVVVPTTAGVFSAVGLLLADRRRDLVRTVAQALVSLDPAAMRRAFSDMETELLAELDADASDIELIRSADLQYRHTLAEINIPVGSLADEGLADEDVAGALGRLFEEAHLRTYGFARELPVEIVNLRLRGVVSTQPPKAAELVDRDAPRSLVTSRRRDVYFERDRPTCTPIVEATDLRSPVQGPMIIERWDTSVSVLPGWQASPTVEGHIYLESVPE
jgi:N-methylhydantoinase A